MQLFRDNTPIETYCVKNRTVYVKRDDLYGIHPAPQLGKLRGLRVFIEHLYDRGERLVGCWDTRVSKLGQGVAAICRSLPGMHAVVSYPTRKGTLIPDSIKIAKCLGAEIYPIRGNHVSICYAQVKKYIVKRGGVMIPFGMECREAVDAIAVEAKKIPTELLEGGTLVLCCGSGVTLAGLLLGLKTLPDKIVGLSSGRSVPKIMACLNRYVINIPKGIQIRPAHIPYYQVHEFDSPFPSHPNYDLKAWKFLVENMEYYSDPLFFWNIGA
jgi:1-aminocyclopropane-1-carboxylate deaminase/D-cysteine desulfhydrase-like pyridoxal-dependent ACC family enzyme